MAFYKKLKDYDDETASWIADRLINLRENIRRSKLGHRDHKNLVIGSWNIRAFDEGTSRRDRNRLFR